MEDLNIEEFLKDTKTLAQLQILGNSEKIRKLNEGMEYFNDLEDFSIKDKNLLNRLTALINKLLEETRQIAKDNNIPLTDLPKELQINNVLSEWFEDFDSTLKDKSSDTMIKENLSDLRNQSPTIRKMVKKQRKTNILSEYFSA